MNIFTTDHPLVSQASCFDARKHPWISLLCRANVLALILTPLVYGFILYDAFTDGVECTDEPPFPGSWTEFLLAGAAVLVFCFVCALLLASGYRLLQFIWKQRLPRYEKFAPNPQMQRTRL
jgi:hypothetical protein